MVTDRKPLPWKNRGMALLAQTSAVVGWLLIRYDVWLYTSGMLTISGHCQRLGERHPSAAFLVSFLAVLPWAMLDGHLFDTPRDAAPIILATAGAMAAAVAGPLLGAVLFPQG